MNNNFANTEQYLLSNFKFTFLYMFKANKEQVFKIVSYSVM